MYSHPVFGHLSTANDSNKTPIRQHTTCTIVFLNCLSILVSVGPRIYPGSTICNRFLCLSMIVEWVWCDGTVLTCRCSASSSRSMALSMRLPAGPVATAARSSWLMYIPRGGRRLCRAPSGAPRLPPVGPDVGRNMPVRLRPGTTQSRAYKIRFDDLGI